MQHLLPSPCVPAASDCSFRSPSHVREPVSELGPPLELTQCRHSIFTTVVLISIVAFLLLHLLLYFKIYFLIICICIRYYCTCNHILHMVSVSHDPMSHGFYSSSLTFLTILENSIEFSIVRIVDFHCL